MKIKLINTLHCLYTKNTVYKENFRAKNDAKNAGQPDRQFSKTAGPYQTLPDMNGGPAPFAKTVICKFEKRNQCNGMYLSAVSMLLYHSICKLDKCSICLITNYTIGLLLFFSTCILVKLNTLSIIARGLHNLDKVFG